MADVMAKNIIGENLKKQLGQFLERSDLELREYSVSVEDSKVEVPGMAAADEAPLMSSRTVVTFKMAFKKKRIRKEKKGGTE